MIVVGHALENDFDALEIEVSFSASVDVFDIPHLAHQSTIAASPTTDTRHSISSTLHAKSEEENVSQEAVYPHQ